MKRQIGSDGLDANHCLQVQDRPLANRADLSCIKQRWGGGKAEMGGKNGWKTYTNGTVGAA